MPYQSTLTLGFIRASAHSSRFEQRGPNRRQVYALSDDSKALVDGLDTPRPLGATEIEQTFPTSGWPLTSRQHNSLDTVNRISEV